MSETVARDAATAGAWTLRALGVGTSTVERGGCGGTDDGAGARAPGRGAL